MAQTCRSFVLDTTVYTKQAVLKTVAIFKEYCSVEVTESGPEIRISVTLMSEEEPHVVEEFLNYALNSSIEQLLIEG
jgi:hypothetical protein